MWDLMIAAVAMMIGDDLPEDKNEVKIMLCNKCGLENPDDAIDYIVDGIYSVKGNFHN